jgi:hypothetical protein
VSDALALGAVTAVLKDLLDKAVVGQAIGAIGGDVSVSALPPDRIRTDETEDNRLNLFLYRVSPNSGWSNFGLPSRNGGERLSNPPLALDLHYLLTAYGSRDFHAEVLLGFAMQALHETPVLPRDAVRAALSSLPPELAALSGSGLAEQVELVKITQEALNPEEMSRLWSALQTRYRPTACYRASVVLVESKLPTKAPLTVLTRGRPDPDLGRDEGVISQPDLLPPFPTLFAATPPTRQPAVRMGETLTFAGHHLEGDRVTVHFTHAHSSEALELPTSDTTSTGFRVQIPPDPAPGPVAQASPQNPDKWRAGVYGAAAVIRSAEGTKRSTNELPVVLAPRMDSIGAEATEGAVTLTVRCSPKVRKDQRATLVVGDWEIPAEPFEPEKTGELTFRSSDLPGGEQWVRLRVDGAESLLVRRDGPLPTFDPSQQVTLP